jgi:hypothetical protein
VGSLRSYNKRALRRKTEKLVEARRETRDAIVWDVLSGDSDRKCRVKIQGSNQLIIAHYPFNWGTNPVWLKPGNAVKINHQGGMRGKIEVIGHGQLVPSPVSGGATSPTIETPPDAILTGLRVTQLPDPSNMKVLVSTGTYRIGGTTYTAGAMTMEAAAEAGLGDNVLLNETTDVVELDAAPASGSYRIDLISIGTDGVIDYAAGTVVSSDPQPDAVAANHVEVATILVYGTMTIVLNKDINATWSAPYLSHVRATISDDALDWMSEATSVITLTAYDQYDVGFSRSIINGGILFSLEFVSGSGTLSDAVSATRSEFLTAQTNHGFTYTRDNDAGDVSPTFTGAAEEAYVMEAVDSIYITLYDSDGVPMQ